MQYQVLQTEEGDMYLLNYLDFESMQNLNSRLKRVYDKISWQNVKICGWNRDVYYGYLLCK